ncbi:MAG TPA: tetratricopeptide repeat protein [Pyrinomonadaceae bacterium]|jgi:hypothetical protein|nr:tetratricopeptide repeat protein [Pyrinomonadaceae bacterium]
MSDPITFGIISVLTSLLFKGGEKLAEKAAEDGYEHKGKILEFLQNRLKGEPLTSLKLLEENPTDSEIQGEFAGQIERLVSKDKKLAEDLKKLLKQLQNNIPKAEKKKKKAIFNFNVSQYVVKSGEFREHEDRLNTLQKLFDRTSLDETEERLELSERINEQRDLIESFKQDVIKLAETFDHIELNTKRLKEAKEHFEKGEITEARVLLEDAAEERLDAKTRALAKKKDYEENVLPTLQNVAAEYLLLAHTTALNYENLNRFEETCSYFRASIESNRNQDNLFQFARFLHEHNRVDEVKIIYQDLLEYIDKDSNDPDGDLRATVFNNLGILHMNDNELNLSVTAFQESLTILRVIASQNHLGFIPKVALILSNLGLVYTNLNEFQKAEDVLNEALTIYRNLLSHNASFFGHYLAACLNNMGIFNKRRQNYREAKDNYDEALSLRRELAKKDPNAHKPDIAMLLTNLGNLTYTVIEIKEGEAAFIEALEIYREFAQKNPFKYEPYLAVTLHNLGALYARQDNLLAAEERMEESLTIRRRLIKNNRLLFEIEVASSLANLSAVFSRLNRDKNEITSLALEALTILFPYLKTAPYIQPVFGIAYNVMSKAGFSHDEIKQKVDRLIVEREKSFT